MTSGVANVWQGCAMYLAWEVVALLAGTAAGIKDLGGRILLSEILRELDRSLGFRGSLVNARR
jgi:hypothetical protein